MNQMAKAAIRGETDVFRRLNNKTLYDEKRIRSIQIKGFHLLVIFTLLLGFAFIAYQVGSFVLTWEKLRVKNFEYANKLTFGQQEVNHILSQYHVNILSLSFSELRQKLLTVKEIKDVYLTRKLPATVEIKFLLRKPVFQVAINGKYNIMDVEGVIVYTTPNCNNDLIEIRDVKSSQLERLVPYLPELSRIKDSIDYISLQDPYGVTLKLKGQKEIFYPGEGNFTAKINYYMKLKENLTLKMYDIKTVDLRFDDRFYFEYVTEVNN